MRRPRYALEPLAKLRDGKVEESKRGLAAATTERDAAERARRAAEARRESHDAAAAAVRATERGALERGELRAGDLALADGWEARVAAERTALAADVTRAGSVEANARDAERQAQRTMAEREADAKVVAKDRARWEAGERRRADAKEEEEAAEAYRRQR
jgi:hypothetical protein